MPSTILKRDELLRRHRIRYRQITETDIPGVVTLLTRRFPRRSKSYWMRGFDRLIARQLIEGFSRFGYLLESEEKTVGALLLIYDATKAQERSAIRCNISSWCVEPEYAGYSPLLIAAALKQKDVTFINISPAVHTLKTMVALGFSCFSCGQYVCLPALKMRNRRGFTQQFDTQTDYGPGLPEEEFRILADHSAYGCIALTIRDGADVHPFVFVPRKIGVGGLGLPAAHLCYCRDVASFRDFAGPIGRSLLKCGRPFVLIDANGDISGLPGRYFDGKAPKYFSGPHPPRLGDLAYTEIAVFGP